MRTFDYYFNSLVDLVPRPLRLIGSGVLLALALIVAFFVLFVG